VIPREVTLLPQHIDSFSDIFAKINMSNISIQGLDLTLSGLTEKLTAFKGKHYMEEENGIKQDCFSHDLTCNLLLEVLNVVFSISKNVIMEHLTELTLLPPGGCD
jgi:hypothetical protein